MEAEKKDNVIAGTTTLVIHGLLLIVLLFSVLNTPIPPLGGGSGVVLNLGYVDEGTGEVQTMNEANDSPQHEEAKPNEETQEHQNVEEQPQQDPSTPDEKWLTSEEETGVEAKEEKEADEPRKPVETKKAPVEEKTESTKSKAEAKTVSGKTGTASEGGNNNGDKEGKVGDQGNPQGELNAKALYGNPGSGGDGPGGAGGGPILNMAGWKMDFKIRTDASNENGRLKFSIVVDEEGEVISIKTLEKSVSTEVENFYKRQIESGSFVKDKNNARVAKNSTGEITIIIRSR